MCYSFGNVLKCGFFNRSSGNVIKLEGCVDLVDGVEDLIEIEVICQSHTRALFNIEGFSDTLEHLGTFLGLESGIGNQKISKIILRNFSRARRVILPEFQCKYFFLE